MAHDIYSPVGYIYNADQYCLDCIPHVLFGRYKSDGYGINRCNCAECRLDSIAVTAGIADRYDEHSFDSGDFAKAIPYHNDIHAECQLEGSWEPHWNCDARCGRCGDVIDDDGNGHCPATDYDALNAALEKENDNDD